MAIEPKRPTEKRRSTKPNAKPRTRLPQQDQIETILEGLYTAHRFFKSPNAKNLEFAGVRGAFLEMLVKGLAHQSEEVWPVAQDLLDDLRKRNKLPKLKGKSEQRSIIEEQKEMRFLAKFDNPMLLRENSNILNVVVDFAKTGSTPIVQTKAIFLLGKTRLKSLIRVLEEIRRTDKNKYVKLVAGRALDMLKNKRK